MRRERSEQEQLAGDVLDLMQESVDKTRRAIDFINTQNAINSHLTQTEGRQFHKDVQKVVAGSLVAGAGLDLVAKVADVAANSQMNILHALQNLGK